MFEHALAAAVKDGERISEFLDVLSRGRLWLPLPTGDGPVTDGSAILLPTVTCLGTEFVPAFSSAGRLAHCGYGPAAEGGERPEAGWSVLNGQRAGWMATRVPSAGGAGPASPHIVVPAAELARRLPPGLGIAVNPGAPASVPIYPEGVRYLAAAEWRAGEARIGSASRRSSRKACCARSRPACADPRGPAGGPRVTVGPRAGEGLIIAVTLDDPADRESQEAVLVAVEQAAVMATARFPIDVTFPGEAEPDDVDRWIADHAMPFHLRA